MTCEMCGKDFKEKLKITKLFLKQNDIFLFPVKDKKKKIKKKLCIFLNQKAYLMVSFPSSFTYSVKNLRSTALI